MHFFTIKTESKAFLELAGKALKGAMTPQEEQQFDRMMKAEASLKSQFNDLKKEVAESKREELWERGLRVLLRVPRSDDKAFLEAVKKTEPAVWVDFLRGAYVLKVMAESAKLPVPSFSNKMTPEAERKLFAAVRKAQDRRKKENPGLK